MHLTDLFVLTILVMFLGANIYKYVEKVIGSKFAAPLYLIVFILLIINVCQY